MHFDGLWNGVKLTKVIGALFRLLENPNYFVTSEVIEYTTDRVLILRTRYYKLSPYSLMMKDK